MRIRSKKGSCVLDGITALWMQLYCQRLKAKRSLCRRRTRCHVAECCSGYPAERGDDLELGRKSPDQLDEHGSACTPVECRSGCDLGASWHDVGKEAALTSMATWWALQKPLLLQALRSAPPTLHAGCALANARLWPNGGPLARLRPAR